VIISFAYTTPALLARSKSVTRREWDAGYAARFHKGDVVQAWDKSPRFGGCHVADTLLTADPTVEPIITMPASDYEAEGFAWLRLHPGTVDTKRFGGFTWADFETWRHSGGDVWVVRFELVKVHETLEAWLARREHKAGEVL
jgi:hypothetical protein